MNTIPLDLVAAWHRRFQVALPPVPTFDPDVIALRIRLLLEEKDELLHTITTQNRVEQLDALCDLQYALSGAILHLGLRERYVWNCGETPFANRPSFYRTEDDLALETRCSVLGIKVRSLAKCCEMDEISATRRAVVALTDCQILLDGLIEATGFAEVFSDAFRRVDENNHGKMWTESDVKWWQEQEIEARVSDNLEFTFSGGAYIAKDKGGKVVKRAGHKKVSLEEFVK